VEREDEGARRLSAPSSSQNVLSLLKKGNPRRECAAQPLTMLMVTFAHRGIASSTSARCWTSKKIFENEVAQAMERTPHLFRLSEQNKKLCNRGDGTLYISIISRKKVLGERERDPEYARGCARNLVDTPKQPGYVSPARRGYLSIRGIFMKDFLYSFFKLKERGTTIPTELIAGFTTFLTMAYIIIVNPSILSITGMDKGAVFVATILATIIGTLIMGLYANVPFAQAPGMGLNAFFTFTVVMAMAFPWQQALAIVFICGIINIVITVTRIRKMLILAIPEYLQYAISAGIGLFIAYIGVKNGHLLNFITEGYNVVAQNVVDGKVVEVVSKDVVPTVVNFKDPASVVTLFGLVVTIILMILRVRGAILIGIVLSTIFGLLPFIGVTNVPSFSAADMIPPSILPTFFKLDIVGLFTGAGGLLVIIATIIAFSLSDTFDTIGTFLGTGRKTGIFDKDDEKALHKGKGFSSRLDRALFADATATSIGSVLGTSNVTTYIESASGISVGGKTGLTSTFVAIFFLFCLFLSPFALMVPSAATAPALIVVGILMMSSIMKIKWDDFTVAVPAFFTAVIMPFTYSIANGVAAGFIFHVIAMIVTGKAKKVHPLLYIVTLLFIANFVYNAVH
jgi:AGZA family xanthine/uracil permease-like MFS transporter